MRRALLPVTLVLLLAGWETTAWPQNYLEGYRGPYKGQVVDAETRQPLVGAVVVAVWSREKIYPLHSSTVHHATRETLTRPDGSFLLDGRDVELTAPRRTLPPYFQVFFPGYGAYRSRFFHERGFRQGQFETGVTIGLPRLGSAQERLANLIRPFSLSDTPFRDLPHLMRLFNAERIDLGLEPYSEP